MPGDDVAVVDLIQKRQHVPIAGVFPLVRAPDVPGRTRFVAVFRRRDAARTMRFGVPRKSHFCGLSVQPPLLDRGIGDLGDFDPVPVDPHVRPDPQGTPALDRDVPKRHHHRLGQARRKPHPVSRDPEPVAVRDLQKRRLGLDTRLGSGEVGTRVRIVHPPIEQQDLRYPGPYPVKSEGQVVRLRVSLEGKEGEVVHIVPVHSRELRGHVPSARRSRGSRVGRSPPVPDRDQSRVGIRRPRHQAFPRKDVHILRVVHHPQRRPVVEDDLFELVHPPHLVSPVPRNQGKRFHLHDFGGIRKVVRIGGQEVAERAAAQKIGHKADPLPVPRVEDGAGRALPVQFLDGRHRLRRHVQLDLLHPSRPEESNVVGRQRSAHPEVHG